MALVSPGVETRLIDESLFVPNASSLVPLFFIATQDEKINADGTPALGTFENSIVRSITSLRQSINFYGVPSFLSDSGQQHHGDARNEYGLFAMNQYLGVGNGAFAIRANVNLNDNLDDIQSQWNAKSIDASVVIQNMVQNFINNINIANGIGAGSASVFRTTSNRVDATGIQSELEFDGTLPYGSAVVGADAVGVAVNYQPGDVVTFTNGMVITIGSIDNHLGATNAGEPTTFTVNANGSSDGFIGTELVVQSVTDVQGNNAMAGSATLHPNNLNTGRSGFTVTPQLANFEFFLQSDVDFTNFNGGVNYSAGDIITMNNNSKVRVVTVDNNGVILTFALITTGNPVAVGTTVNAIAVTPVNNTAPQSGFNIVVAPNNLETLRTSVNSDELKAIVVDATNFIFDEVLGIFSFRNLANDFFEAKSDTDLTRPLTFEIFTNGFDFAPSSERYIGFDGKVELGDLMVNGGQNAVIGEWTPAEAADLFGEAAMEFQFTLPFFNGTSLGTNDASRRVSIVSALQSAIISNTDVRSENFQFNVVACPGYPEVVDELLALSVDQKNEILVVSETPANLNTEDVTNPINGWAATTARQNSTDVAYYFPWCLAANLDGVNVLASPSGTAIRQMAVNDNISFLWFAPAGTTRGLVTGVTDVGYALGVVGGPTTFLPIALNQGQRDALYQDTPSGRINPIVFQPGRGITLMGQKTSSPRPSALDRINVVRLVMHVRRQLRLTSVNFLFEPNDQRTRDNVKAVADNFLNTILTNRGIIDFLTICDESNNTPDVVDRSELVLDVLIRPTKAVEFITIPIRVVSQGAEL